MVNVRGKGIVISEPSWVALDKRTREPLSIGAEAKEMVGRAPTNIIVVRPLRDGVISEFEITQAMLEYFIGKVHPQFKNFNIVQGGSVHPYRMRIDFYCLFM